MTFLARVTRALLRVANDEHMKMTRTVADKMSAAVVAELKAALQSHGEVRVSGLGSFRVVLANARLSPVRLGSSELALTSAHKMLRFRMAKSLRPEVQTWTLRVPRKR